jgi:hypothetical protein
MPSSVDPMRSTRTPRRVPHGVRATEITRTAAAVVVTLPAEGAVADVDAVMVAEIKPEPVQRRARPTRAIASRATARSWTWGASGGPLRRRTDLLPAQDRSAPVKGSMRRCVGVALGQKAR